MIYWEDRGFVYGGEVKGFIVLVWGEECECSLGEVVGSEFV